MNAKLKQNENSMKAKYLFMEQNKSNNNLLIIILKINFNKFNIIKKSKIIFIIFNFSFFIIYLNSKKNKYYPKKNKNSKIKLSLHFLTKILFIILIRLTRR